MITIIDKIMQVGATEDLTNQWGIWIKTETVKYRSALIITWDKTLWNRIRDLRTKGSKMKVL